ncbi:hypothetical protein Tco_0622738 [Tanacetum coccineum]
MDPVIRCTTLPRVLENCNFIPAFKIGYWAFGFLVLAFGLYWAFGHCVLGPIECVLGPNKSPPSPPPPPPPPSGASGASGTTGASDSTQAPPLPPPSSSTHQGAQSQFIPDDLYMDDETTADEQAYSSGDEVGRDHIPIVNLRQSWWKPLTKDRPATPEPAWTIPSSDMSMPTNNWASALKSTYAPPQENSLLAQTGIRATFMGICTANDKNHFTEHFETWKALHSKSSKCFILTPCNHSTGLLLQQRPGVSTIWSQGWQTALSISKMKATYYPGVGLEQLVPDQFWIEEDQENRRAVKDSYAYLNVKGDFKDMYPSDFEDLYLLNLQGHLNHLSPEDKKILTTAVNLWTRNLVIRQRVEDFQLGIESYQTQLDLTKPRWEATGFEFKHDFTVIDLQGHIGLSSQGIPGQQDYSRDESQIWTIENVDKATTSCSYPKTTKDKRIYQIWRALLVDGFEKATTVTSREPNRDPFYNVVVIGSSICAKPFQISMYILRGAKWYIDAREQEIRLKMNLPDHRIKLWWKWRYLVPVESIHSPMLTLNVFNQRQHDNLKTYNTAFATLISNVMIKKSVSMPVRRSQHHMKAMLLNKDD